MSSSFSIILGEENSLYSSKNHRYQWQWHATAKIAQQRRDRQKRHGDKRADLHEMTTVAAAASIDRSYIRLPAMSQLLSKLFIILLLLKPIFATDIIVDWSPESVLFSKGHLVTKKFAKMRDQIVFECSEDMPIGILMVTKDEAIKCDASIRYNQTLIGLCTPERKRINFVVRDFSLLPNVPIFKEGEEYYFISTSNGTENGMKNTAGGLCRSHDMRLALKVSGKASSKSDTNRSPDILSLLSPFSTPSQASEDLERNRVVAKESTTIPITTSPTTPENGVVDLNAPYPAYVVFPDRLSIIVKSEKELKNVIDSYMDNRRPSSNRDYNIYPIKEFKKPHDGAIVWEDPRFPVQNTQYEIQGTASPLSSEHQPHFEVESGVLQKRKKVSEQHRASRTQIERRYGKNNNNNLENFLPFDYEIGYEDAFSGGTRNLQAISIVPIFVISFLITRIAFY